MFQEFFTNTNTIIFNYKLAGYKAIWKFFKFYYTYINFTMAFLYMLLHCLPAGTESAAAFQGHYIHHNVQGSGNV